MPDFVAVRHRLPTVKGFAEIAPTLWVEEVYSAILKWGVISGGARVAKQILLEIPWRRLDAVADRSFRAVACSVGHREVGSIRPRRVD